MVDELENRLRRGLSEAASVHQPSLGAEAAADAFLREAWIPSPRSGRERLGGARSPGPARNRWLAGLVVAGAAAAVAALVAVGTSTTSLSTASRSAESGAAHSTAGAGSGELGAGSGGLSAGSDGAAGGISAGAGGGSAPGGTSGGSAPVVVTQADQGWTVTMTVGQTLEVHLSGGRSQQWSVPRAADTGVLEGTASSADPTSGGASATFVARTAGSTRVSSQARPICTAGQACPDFVRLWTITVDVTG